MGLISKRIQTTDIQSRLTCSNTKGATGGVKKNNIHDACFQLLQDMTIINKILTG
jgi:hypothetical protein